MTHTQIKFFTPAWFKALFRGEHSLGDTFWGGVFGVQLVFIPLWVAAEFFIQITVPTLEPTVFLISNVIFLIYSLLLTRAVLIVARKSPKSGGWRWAAVIYCALSAGIFAWLVSSAVTALSAL